jgi:hypothetical protein
MRFKKVLDAIDGSFALAYIMSYAVIFALVALLGILAAVFIGRRWRGNERSPFKRDGDIFTFRDRGNQITTAIELQPGTYKLQYQFPTGVLVKVDLISLGGGDSETLFIKSGSGSQALRIETGGRYSFQIKPVQEQAEWSFEISPLGLPSRRE